MGFIRRLRGRMLLERAKKAAAFGDYREARSLFQDVLATSSRDAHRREAALGAAQASSRLFEPVAVREALTRPEGIAFDDWPDDEAAEAALLLAKASMEGDVGEALALQNEAARRAAAHLGVSIEGPLDAAAAAETVRSHPDARGAERLAIAAVGLAEFYGFTWEFRLAADWLKAAAAGVGRAVSTRSLELLDRLHGCMIMLDERTPVEEEADRTIDALPLDELLEMAWAARERGAIAAGETPVEAIHAFRFTRLHEEQVESGEADVILDDLVTAIAELERLEAWRLLAVGRFHLARLLCEKAHLTAVFEFKALPFDRQQAMQEAEAPLPIDIPDTVEPLLVEAAVVFNADRPDRDDLLSASLILLAEVARVRGDMALSESIARHCLAMTPADPSAMWRVCMNLSQAMVQREALGAAVFWAKMGLVGLSAASRWTNAVYATEQAGPALLENFIDLLVDLLRRQGRIGEAGAMLELVRHGGDPDCVPWTAPEVQVRTRLLESLASIEPKAPLDLSEEAGIHAFVAAVEEGLEGQAASSWSDFERGAGVAVLTIAPEGPGVSLHLVSDELDWSRTLEGSFTPRWPLSLAVGSLVGAFSSPPGDPHGPFPELFLQSSMDQVSEVVLGWLPSLEAHTLVLRAAGIFRFLPFAPMGIGRPLVERFPLLSCPARPVVRAPVSRPPRLAFLALGPEELAGAGEEAEMFARLSGENGLTAKVGPEADRRGLEDLLRSDSTILHLATHCVAHSAEPAASTLRLGDGSTVTLGELADYDLSGFELLTLAACASGLPGGAGLATPVDLLHGAGACRVLTALWPVDDAATALFMRHFYAALFSPGEPSPAEALRMAQLATRALYPHPHFWAAFHLSALPD